MTQLSRTLLVVSSGIMLMAVPGAGCSEATPAPGGQLGGGGGASGQVGTAGTTTGGSPMAGSGGMGGKSNGGAGGALVPSAGSGGTSAGSGGTSAGSGGSSAGSGGTSAGSGGTSAGSGGTSAGSGGSAGSPPEPQPCTDIMPFVSPTIYEFPEPQAGGTGGGGGTGGAATTPVESFSFGYTGNVASGYSFFYPDTLTSDISQGSWHISGSVGTYAGFQIGLVCGADASAYKGITFKIAGNAGPSGSIDFAVAHAADTWSDPTNPSASAAKCMAPSAYNGTCVESHATITVGQTQTTVSLKWADIKGGKPEASPNPAELVALRWLFHWDGGAAAAYPVNLTVDDIRFIE